MNTSSGGLFLECDVFGRSTRKGRPSLTPFLCLNVTVLGLLARYRPGSSHGLKMILNVSEILLDLMELSAYELSKSKDDSRLLGATAFDTTNGLRKVLLGELATKSVNLKNRHSINQISLRLLSRTCPLLIFCILGAVFWGPLLFPRASFVSPLLWSIRWAF